jgi:integrase
MMVRFGKRFLRELEKNPPPAGKRVEYTDFGGAKGFGLRINDKGRITWILIARLPGNKDPSRLTLGHHPEMDLDEARETAIAWRKLIKAGKDPREVKNVEEQKTVAAVAAELITHLRSFRLRTVDTIERTINRVLLPAWGPRPISDITWPDVKAIVDATKARGKLSQARHIFAYCRLLFNFAREQGYITTSPCDRMRPSKFIAPQQPRQHTLNNDELRVVYKAAERTPYPWGPIVRMLVLTGQRRSEVIEAVWSEFDMPGRLWTIPADRMKNKAPHTVPLVDDVMAILATLPRFAGPHLFSTGAAPPTNSTIMKWKREFDKALGVGPYRLHDLRRTMRTRLSALPIEDIVRELVISHTRPGLHKIYDLHEYDDEKREALELWAQRLSQIVTPNPEGL